MMKRIMNIDELSFKSIPRGDYFDVQIGPIGLKLGSQKLGFNVSIIPPGKRAFPYHAHHGNEEMYFILEGRGSIRIDAETHPIRKGDFISLPPGRESAHQIINTSDDLLRYIAVSTMQSPDVVEYPDSGKVGAIAGAAPGRPEREYTIRHFSRARDGVRYWDDER